MKSLFLHGYGLSIKVKDTRLVFSQGSTSFVTRQEPLEIPVSKCSFDKVIIQGKGFVSTEALERLAESNINVIMLDKRGKLYMKLEESRNTRLRSGIKLNRIHEIGNIRPIIRQINPNADSKRFWLGEITDIDAKICNNSMPLSFTHYTKETM